MSTYHHDHSGHEDEDETATAPLGHVLPNCTCDGYSTTCPSWAAFVDRFESAT